MEEKWLAAIAFIIAAVALLFAYIWSVSWVIRDAQKRGQTGCLTILLVALWGPLAAVVWLVFRPKRLVDKSPCDYQNAEDAISAASRLDNQGDWNAAIRLYQFSAERWPEHQSYIEQCVDQIKKKQALTSG